MTAERGLTISRLLNQLAYTFATDATDIGTVAANDRIPIYDASAEFVGFTTSTGLAAVTDNAGNDTVTATGGTTARTLADRAADIGYVEDFGAVADGTASSGTDNSAAFTAALAAHQYVSLRSKSGRYWLGNVDIPTGKTLDLRSAIIQPIAGASYCFRQNGDGAMLYGGRFLDSPDNLLKGTTLTSSASAGATSVAVASVASLYVGGLIIIVGDADIGFTGTDGWPADRKVVHHCLVSSIASLTVGLSEPLRYDAASGNAVKTSLGFVVTEASDCVVEGGYFSTGSMVGTLRSPVAGGGIGKGAWRNLRVNTMRLGGVLTANSVSSWEYGSIKGYLDYSGSTYCAGFGMKMDASLAASTFGGHHYTRCDMLGSQEGFDLQNGSIVSYTDCYADTCGRLGYRFGDGTVRVFVDGAWSMFNQKGVSITGASSLIHIRGLHTDNRAVTVPWGGDIDLEVEDGCTGIYVDSKQWSGSRIMRTGAGWETVSNIRQGLGAQDGTVGLPAVWFTSDPDSGFYMQSTLRAGFGGSARWFWGANDSGPLTTPIRELAQTVAQANALTNLTAGNLVYCSNGDTGSPCLAVWNGTSWLRVALGAAIASS